MSLEIIALVLLFGMLVAGIILFFVARRQRREAEKSNAFKWKPELDYDVEQRGETSMTPAWPVMVKRGEKPKDN